MPCGASTKPDPVVGDPDFGTNATGAIWASGIQCRSHSAMGRALSKQRIRPEIAPPPNANFAT